MGDDFSKFFDFLRIHPGTCSYRTLYIGLYIEVSVHEIFYNHSRLYIEIAEHCRGYYERNAQKKFLFMEVSSCPCNNNELELKKIYLKNVGRQ